MRIDIITVLQELIESPFNHSILKRAKEKKLVEIEIHNLRDYSTNKHKRVDDYAFSGGAGMVLQVEPVDRAISDLKSKRNYDEIIYTSPDGELFDQPMANQMSVLQNIIILCGHYKGIDHRVREYLITREISIGNFVMTGGELAAAVIADSIVRLIPGVISDETSALSDSFQTTCLPRLFIQDLRNIKVGKCRDILLSGNAKEIEKWQMEQSIERTKKLRPDLYKKL
jgi:tRNA (guanine37-N1)-methyltransferase